MGGDEFSVGSVLCSKCKKVVSIKDIIVLKIGLFLCPQCQEELQKAIHNFTDPMRRK